jgi:inhibitor of cysteine peptidase
MREITKADSGRELDVGVGETIKLGLPENPTTGYRWQLRSSGGPVLELAEHDFVPSRETVGAGGLRCWTFRAVRAGVARLELEQRRSWERQATDTFSVTISVMAQ